MSQIFSANLPSIHILFDFLKKICEYETDDFYYITRYSHKKAIFENHLNLFIRDVLPYYKPSKRFFVEREINYKNMITIIRQLSHLFNIKLVSEIKYNKSKYEFCYKIYKLVKV